MSPHDGPWTLLASEHPRKGHATLWSPRPNVVLGTTAGDGDSLNPKLSPNEDSAAVAATRDGIAMAVADAHFGASSSESAARAFVRRMQGAPSVTPETLTRCVVDLDVAVREARRGDDRSETTFLAATLDGTALTWAAVGDSVLFVLAPGAELTRVVPSLGIYLGDRWNLSAMRDAGERFLEGVLHAGTRTLAPGTVVMLATDGIEEDCSGLSDARIAEVLREDRPLAPRIETLLGLGGRLPRGGRDNLTVVAMELAR